MRTFRYTVSEDRLTYLSVLAALLGEMDCISGTVLLPKTDHRVDPETGLVESLSFCSQHPWLESSASSNLWAIPLLTSSPETIKENILFGSPLDEQVRSFCSLFSYREHSDVSASATKMSWMPAHLLPTSSRWTMVTRRKSARFVRLTQFLIEI